MKPGTMALVVAAAFILMAGTARAAPAAAGSAPEFAAAAGASEWERGMAPAGLPLLVKVGSRDAVSPSRPILGLGAERARILLRSLTVPGWGQATLGRRTSAKVFLLAETGVWASYAAFRVQETLRRQSSEVQARLFAAIDLDGRDEEFRRIVGI